MVFSSLTFIYAFLPLAILAHYLTKNILFRNITLILFSLVFYAWGEPLWLFLLLITAIFDFGVGLLIERMLLKSKAKAKAVLIFGVVVNLSLLIGYKYGGFLWDNINMLLQNFGWEMPFPRPTNSLPIGISFYSFQVIAYLVDVYRRDTPAQKNPINFLVCISMFPHLVAGPIIRYSKIHDELDNRKVNWSDLSYGINRFCFGLFKKVIIANTAGELVQKYLEDGFHDLSSYEGWFGIAMFSIQIYFDFSGYSDMAIGLARMFGFHFDENFRHPYAAISVGDFYRRWHISLGRFFRDYVYIPLGGNRKFQLRNIVIVWLLTGIWHGASWNFLLWGAYFGCFMVIEKLLDRFLQKTPRILRHTYTLILIVFSRGIFYFTDWNQLKSFTINLFTSNNAIGAGFYTDLYEHVFWFVAVVLLCIPWEEIYTEGSKLNRGTSKLYGALSPAFNLAFIALSTAMLVDSTYNPFIYFRF
ncbi:MAG: MBOAT family O-acyltransferase [Bacteroidota bacterium]